MCSIVFLAALVLGDPPAKQSTTRPDKAEKPQAINRQEAGLFATQLRELSNLICQRYARPVSRERLIRVGLRGLYKSAGQSMPSLVSGLLHQAMKDEPELHRYLTAIRQNLGDPEAIRGQKAIRSSLLSMIQSLDSYCALVTNSQLQADETDGECQGFGFDLEEAGSANQLKIKAVRLGGPAQKAGLRPGDLISSVDGLPLAAATINQPNGGSRSNSLRLTVRRGGQATTSEITLKSAHFSSETVLGSVRRPENTWDYFLDQEQGIAHVRLARLGRGTADELAQTVETLQAAGMRALILDLRWCPGGYLSSSCRVAGLFLGDYGLPFLFFPTPANWPTAMADLVLDRHSSNATVTYRDGSSMQGDALGAGGYTQFPMIVLVNDETSGGAELVAAVLQDNRRALIAGRRTRGKASVQALIPLSNRDSRQPLTVQFPDLSLKLTTGFMTRPSGKSMNRLPTSRRRDDWGVRPDPGLEIRVSPEFSKQLKEWWLLLDLRPGTSAEGLPLDDPWADPQRRAALQYLREILRKQN
jgi:carboxyl-terminal processing protease